MGQIPKDSKFIEEIYTLKDLVLEFTELESDMWIEGTPEIEIVFIKDRLRLIHQILFLDSITVINAYVIIGLSNSIHNYIVKNLSYIKNELYEKFSSLKDRVNAICILVKLTQEEGD